MVLLLCAQAVLPPSINITVLCLLVDGTFAGGRNIPASILELGARSRCGSGPDSFPKTARARGADGHLGTACGGLNLGHQCDTCLDQGAAEMLLEVAVQNWF